jgi:hypothetical protein
MHHSPARGMGAAYSLRHSTNKVSFSLPFSGGNGSCEPHPIFLKEMMMSNHLPYEIGSRLDVEINAVQVRDGISDE